MTGDGGTADVCSAGASDCLQSGAARQLQWSNDSFWPGAAFTKLYPDDRSNHKAAVEKATSPTLHQ